MTGENDERPEYFGLVPQYYSDSDSQDESDEGVVINDAWLNESDISDDDQRMNVTNDDDISVSNDRQDVSNVGDAFDSLCTETLEDFKFDLSMLENLDLPIDNVELDMGAETEKALQDLLKETDLEPSLQEIDAEEWSKIWNEITELNEGAFSMDNINPEPIKTEIDDDDYKSIQENQTFIELQNVELSKLQNNDSVCDIDQTADVQSANDQKFCGTKRKYDSSNSDDDIVIKQFRPETSSDFFKTETGSEFSVSPSSTDNSSNDDSADRDVTRSVLHILTAPYFDLKYPDDKRAMFIMSRACDQLLNLSSELHTMYRHVVRNRSKKYMKTMRRNIRITLIELLVDMLISRSDDYYDVISMSGNFEECFKRVIEDQDFQLPMKHSESEKDLESYRQLICDRAIITTSIEINAMNIMSSISPVIIHNDTVVTTYVYLMNLLQEKYKSKLISQVQHYLYHSLHVPYC